MRFGILFCTLTLLTLTSGNFAHASQFLPALTYPLHDTPHGLATADFNGDGNLDIAIPNYPDSGNDNYVAVFLGNGDGSFKVSVNYSLGAAPYDIAVGDLNGDGKLDIVTANQVSYDVLLGNGDGTFRTSSDNAVAYAATNLILADFNHDGILDLVFCGTDQVSTAEVLLGNGDGTFGFASSFPTGGRNVSALTAADLNGDGALDLAFAHMGVTTVLFGHGDGTFGTPSVYQSGVPSYRILARDLNQDGDLDLVTALVHPGPMVYLNNGDGTFAPGVVYDIGLGEAFDVAVADMNADSLADLVVTDQGGTFNLLFGRGNGTFTRALQYDAETGSQYLNIADYNNDGHPDLAITAFFTLGEVIDDLQIFRNTGDLTPVVDLNPTSLRFPATFVGQHSHPQQFLLRNHGPSVLTIANVTVSGDFTQQSHCAKTVGIGQRCNFSVTFTPTATGRRDGEVTIVTSDGSHYTEELSGIGK
ncbi:MAG: VCBS repeat-containing protein [Acidobacteriales bacterium]|nr:VCBS repeat-containing protein [Terriglobales bacterium]